MIGKSSLQILSLLLRLAKNCQLKPLDVRTPVQDVTPETPARSGANTAE
jgi:hypothetical protein